MKEQVGAIGTAWPLVGIFARRGRAHPNRIGLSQATIVAVDGRIPRVRGLDGIDGAPVLDVKPQRPGLVQGLCFVVPRAWC